MPDLRRLKGRLQVANVRKYGVRGVPVPGGTAEIRGDHSLAHV